MSVGDPRTPFVSKVQIEDADGDVVAVTAGGAITVTGPSGAGSTTIQGTAADGAAAVGNPVQIGGVDGSGNAQSILTDTSGRQQVVGAVAAGAAVSGNPVMAGVYDGTNAQYVPGNTNGVFVQGNVTSGSAIGGRPIQTGGAYSTNANQPAVTTGQVVNLQADSAGNLRTAPQRPTATDILANTLAHTSTTGATTIITVAAGRTWVGTVTISCDVGVAAASATAGQALGVVTTAGTNVVPAAGTYLACEARAGANAATGTVGSQGCNQNSIPMTVVAPAGNSVTIQATTTIAGTNGRVDYAAFGVQQ